MSNFWSDRISYFLSTWLIPLGMVVFLAGKIFLPGSASHITQTYIWLMFPSLLLIIFGGKKIFQGYKPTALDLTILAFLLLNTVSFFWSSTDKPFDRFYKDFLYITLFLFAISTLIRNPKNDFIKVMYLSGSIVVISAVIALINYIFIKEVSLNYRHFRISNMGLYPFGYFSNPIPAAIFYSVFTVFFFVQLLEARGKWMLQAVLFTAVCILLTYVLMTGSRGPTFSLLLSFVCLWCLRKDRRTATLCMSLFSFVLVFGISSGAIKTDFIASLSNKNPVELSDIKPISAGSNFRELPEVQEFEEQLNQTFGKRGTIWFNALELIGEKPWLGHGIDADFDVPFDNGRITAQHPHSLYLQILYDTGIVGLFLFLTISVLALKACWQHRENALAQVAFATFVLALANFLTDIHQIFHRPYYYWVFFWLPVGMTIGMNTKKHLAIIYFHTNTFRKKKEFFRTKKSS